METKPEDLIEETEKNLYQISEKELQNNIQTFQSSVEGNRLAKKHTKGRPVVGISSDFTDLDAKLGGFHPSDLIIIAGGPQWERHLWQQILHSTLLEMLMIRKI